MILDLKGLHPEIAAEASKYRELMPRQSDRIAEVAMITQQQVNTGEPLDAELAEMACHLDELLDEEGAS